MNVMTLDDFMSGGGSTAPSSTSNNSVPPAPVHEVAGNGMSLQDFAGGNLSTLKPVNTANPSLTISDKPAEGYAMSSGLLTPTPQTSQSQEINQNYQTGQIGAKDVVLQDFGEAARQTNEALLSPWSPLGWINNAIGVASNAVGNFLQNGGGMAGGVGIDAIAKAVGGTLRAAVGADNADKVGQAVVNAANSPAAQAIEKTYNNPAVKGDLAAVGNVANLAATTVMAGQGAEAMGDIGPAIANAKAALQDHYVETEKANWAKPGNVSKPGYAKPADILETAQAKGTDIPDVLVKNGVRLSDSIEGGNYATADTAAQLRTDAGKMSREFLRPSLQMADYTMPKTPIEDVVNQTIKDIKNSKGITPGDIETQIEKVKTEGDALARKYPDGMSLTDMHDEKINYAQNGRYSPVGDTNVNNTASVNRAFGRSLAGFVEEKAPSGIPVKEFNAELQKQYQAADYLDSLDGKKVPKTIMSRIANTAGKGIGALVGNQLGAGILGDVAGYHLGGMVESALENLPDPIRGHFLNNLEMTNPKAFDALREFIGQEQMARLQRRMLPAARQSTLSAVEPMKGPGGLSGVPYEGDRPASGGAAR